MGSSHPIERKKLSDLVMERLLERIERGEFPPGSQLPSERELMKQFQVGRPAIREALQGLQRMGLISITHGERARVEALKPKRVFDQIAAPVRHLLVTNPATLEHLKEARMMFEVAMVRLAADQAQPEDIDLLRQRLEEHRATLGNPEEFVRTDIAFHTAIASVTGNPIFTAISEAMLGWLFEFYAELVRFPGHEEITFAEHERIFHQIAARDPEGAARAMTEHLNRSNPLHRTAARSAAPPDS